MAKSDAEKSATERQLAYWLRLHPDVEATLATKPDDYSPIVSANRWKSLRYALAGWLYMLKYGKNTRIQMVFSIFVFVIGLWVGLTPVEWAIIVLTITINWIAEFINGALEAAINLASPTIHPMARVGKDVGAAASLLASVAAAVIGALIVLPPLLEKIAPPLLKLFIK
ncbi:MAG: diacylglycerol kinase family protein [Anaerolineae bacterium]|nr:diacylglycerol kinase family protein [Anaerolineae bacterium]